jgi:hypothetical protein
MPNMPSAAESSYVWVWVDASYLREQAQRCSRVARDCPHLATSHELEAIGTELMQKAAELDQLQNSGSADLLIDETPAKTKPRKNKS